MMRHQDAPFCSKISSANPKIESNPQGSQFIGFAEKAIEIRQQIYISIIDNGKLNEVNHF